MEDVFNRFRSQIMGASIIWIFFFHLPVDVSVYVFPLKLLKSFGFVGVDVFFMLSGFGVFHSFSKGGDTYSFLSKKIGRIVPSYWIALFFLYFCYEVFFQKITFVNLLSFVGFDFLFFGITTTWFPIAILLTYIFSSVFKDLALKGVGSLSLVLLFLLVAFFILLIAPWLKIYIFRLPAFVLGYFLAFFAEYPCGSRRAIRRLFNSIFWVLVWAFLFVFLMLYVRQRWDPTTRVENGYIWLISSFGAYPAAFLFSSCLSVLDRYISWLSVFLDFYGKASFEFYLTHVVLLEIFNRAGLFTMDSVFFIALLLFVASTVFAYFLKIIHKKYFVFAGVVS